MTLIAFNATTDGVDIITDTWTYEGTGRSLGRHFKVFPIPYLDAVVLTQGSAQVSDLLKGVTEVIAESVSGVDELVTWAAESFKKVWASEQADVEALNRVTGGTRRIPPTVAFLIGYSRTAGRFRAVGLASDTDFKPFDIEGLHIMPSPFSLRPSDLELNRLAADIEADGPRPGDSDNLEFLRALPEPSGAPTTPEEWAQLALEARTDRSIHATVSTRMKVFVGGQLWLTRLERGLITHANLASFEDSGDELTAIMAGTLHPLGQMGPCACGSGTRYIDCHLAAIADDPCLCGSGRPLRDCCLIAAPVLAEVHV